MENPVKECVKSFLAALLLTFSTGGHAGLADPLYVSSSGTVTLRYLGFEAAYTNTLWQHSPLLSGPIFVNKTTPVGSVFELGIFPRVLRSRSAFSYMTPATLFSVGPPIPIRTIRPMP